MFFREFTGELTAVPWRVDVPKFYSPWSTKWQKFASRLIIFAIEPETKGDIPHTDPRGRAERSQPVLGRKEGAAVRVGGQPPQDTPTPPAARQLPCCDRRGQQPAPCRDVWVFFPLFYTKKKKKNALWFCAYQRFALPSIFFSSRHNSFFSIIIIYIKKKKQASWRHLASETELNALTIVRRRRAADYHVVLAA